MLGELRDQTRRKGDVRVYNQRVGRTTHAAAWTGSLHRRGRERKKSKLSGEVHWRRTFRQRDVSGRRTVRWTSGLPERETRNTGLGAMRRGHLGGCLGWPGDWGFRLSTAAKQCYCRLRRRSWVPASTHSRVGFSGRSGNRLELLPMPRCGDGPSEHLPMDGSGVEKLGEKWGRDGGERRHVKQGSLQCVWSGVGHNS